MNSCIELLLFRQTIPYIEYKLLVMIPQTDIRSHRDDDKYFRLYELFAVESLAVSNETKDWRAGFPFNFAKHIEDLNSGILRKISLSLGLFFILEKNRKVKHVF